MIDTAEGIRLDESELAFSYILASGPGGQNVNKTASAAQLRFDVRGSPSLPPGVKARLTGLAGGRMTREGEIVITARRFRSQERNRADALARLVALIAKAAAPPPAPRVRTVVSRAEKEQRLRAKARRSEVKSMRARPDQGD
jgi:ribosome-associated protein